MYHIRLKTPRSPQSKIRRSHDGVLSRRYCEYALLTTPCEVIRLARQYIVRIHGAPTPLIRHMSKCGYGAEFVHRVTNYVDVYRFTIGGY
ncbi:MAG: hypothetical protein QXW44_07910 [Pyrobaculum sp.]